MSDKYELVRFEKDGLTLDVNVSPSERRCMAFFE